jgi:clan AA aspartic protease
MPLTTRVRIRGSQETLELEAIIDTGFDGDLCIPKKLAVALGLQLVGITDVELADGSRREELVFRGQVRFLGKTRDAEILLSDSEDLLIGLSLLSGCKMSVDFDAGNVRLKRKL